MGGARITERSLRGGRATAAASGLAAGALVVAHALMLATRLRDASIVEPAIALRWLGAAGVLLLAFLFRHRSLPLLRGRTGLVLALLVLLLHVGASPVPAVDARANGLLIELPIGFAAALVLGRIGLVAARRCQPMAPRLGRLLARAGAGLTALVRSCAPLAFFPRPPPTR